MNDDNAVDVIAVEIATGKILWVDEANAPEDAEAIIKMAVFRQGVEDRFFTTAPCGKFKQGDIKK